MTDVRDNQVEPTNWGRWGLDDELGTLNFITGEVRARGVAEATTGRVVSLAVPITPVPLAGAFGSGQHAMPAAVVQSLNFVGTASTAFTDMLMINVHHTHSTHIDALAHVNSEGKVYPGIPVEEAIAGGTVRRSSSTPFTTGITTRGVLLDLAPDGALEARRRVTAADFERAEQRGNIRVESGDALVVRAGWTVSPETALSLPTLTLDAVTWMADREVSLYAGDISDEPPIVPGGSVVVHKVALGRLGMPLIDGVETDELARACRELGRYSFLFVLGTIPVTGATGLPVMPLAIF
jgi:kynurenine formamidase